MPSGTAGPTEVIGRLSRRPDCLDCAMIRIKEEPSMLPYLKLADRPRSFGTLARLPLEIQHTILNMLDLQTISRISRVSVHGLAVVQSLPSCQELLEHAPGAVAALSRTKLLSLHSMIQLRRVLRSDRCECCPEYGAYLFLPTCVRCCWECLNVNPSLRAISLKEAKRYFGLKERHLEQLPVLHTIPGNYIFSQDTQASHPLVSAVAAKELGILVHGSADNLALSLVRRFKTEESIVIGRFLQRASATPLGEDPLAGPFQGNIPPYDFFGMASTPFPSLQAPGIVESGLWCKGCRFTFELYGSGRLDSVVLSRITPPGCDPYRVLHGMSRRARSKAGFLEHTRHCFGAQKLIQDLSRDEESR